MKGLLGLVAILVAAYAVRTGFRHFMGSVGTDKASTCVEVLNNTTTEAEGATYIIGSIRNNCDASIGHVTIVFKLERASGPMEDLPETSAQAYARDIKAGEIREFKTALPVPRDSSYRFDSVHAF